MTDINLSLCDYYTEFDYNQCFQKNHQFSILNLNVRSLPKHIDAVKHFIDGLHNSFSILFFTETWLCEYNVSTHIFLGYSHVFKLMDKNKVGGGVSMYIDSRINYQSRNDINIDIDLVDVIAIEISKEELNTNLNITLITLYRPPNIQIKLFTDKLTDLLHYLSKENKYIFIIGDFNVDTSSAIINPNVHVNKFRNIFYLISIFL